MFSRLFAGSLRDLLHINVARPGALGIVSVHLRNKDSFTGSIITFGPLGSNNFSLKLHDSANVLPFQFGKGPLEVESVTCEGKLIHIDIPSDAWQQQTLFCN